MYGRVNKAIVVPVLILNIFTVICNSQYKPVSSYVFSCSDGPHSLCYPYVESTRSCQGGSTDRIIQDYATGAICCCKEFLADNSVAENTVLRRDIEEYKMFYLTDYAYLGLVIFMLMLAYFCMKYMYLKKSLNLKAQYFSSRSNNIQDYNTKQLSV